MAQIVSPPGRCRHLSLSRGGGDRQPGWSRRDAECEVIPAPCTALRNDRSAAEECVLHVGSSRGGSACHPHLVAEANDDMQADAAGVPAVWRLGERLKVLEVSGRPVVLDEALWVRMRDVDEVGYIEGNAHLGRGRIRVHFPDSGRCDALAWPKDELTAFSPAAGVWFEGFLAASEPSVYEYLGIGGRGRLEEPSEAEYTRWEEFNARCRLRGWFPSEFDVRPARPVRATAAERQALHVEVEALWAYAGERVWTQRGGAWVEADPQPVVDEGAARHGSVCERRGNHDLSWLEDDWTVCVDCGYVSDDAKS